jgi:CshA-type fibril repeat protein
VKLCGINPAETPNNCTQTSLTVPGEGTYTVNGDGTVTFDPLPTFTGTVATPVKYQAKDSLNRFVNTTITPTVGPPPVPTATADAISDAYDTNQTYTPLANDTAGAADFPLSATSVKLCGINPVQTPNNCTQTSLTVPGEGTYTVNADGTVTFNPLPTFTGAVATSVTYQAKDSLNRFVDETITPTVGFPPPPSATADAIRDAYDTNQTYTPLGNDTRGATDFPLLASSVKLCGVNPAESPNNCTQTTLSVLGVGTYTVNGDGTVLFDPLPSFAGTVATPVRYQAKDSLNRFVDTTITPTVTPPPINVVNDASSGLYDVNQVIPVLTNDTPGAQWVLSSVKLCGLADAAATPPVTAETAPSCTKPSVTVPGEGTYTVNPDGTVTFNPLPSFTGTAQTPVTYQVTDILGRTEDATITPTVGPPPVPTASPDALTRAYDTDQTYTPLVNDTPGAVDFPLSAASVKLCGTSPAQTPNNCDKTTLTVAGEGTYTVNGDGTVSFDPLPTFTGTVATPVTYQAKDSLNRFVNTTITPTVLPPPVPTATADAITTSYDTNQTYTPLGNDTPGAADFPLSAASVKLCGITPVQIPNNCDKTTLTVPGEGTYTVNGDGTVTFDPLPTFTGTVATPVRYQANDSLNRFVNTTITPTIGLPPIPTAAPDAITTAYDTNQTYTPLANDTRGAVDFPLLASSVKLCGINPAQTPNSCDKTSLTVHGEGTYTVNPDGTVTFDPSNTFSGTVATPVTYQAKDSLNRFVNTTITPTITPPPINVVNDTSSGLYDVNQVIPVLTNDTPGAQWVLSSVKLCGINPSETPNNCTQTSLTVPGEGTYTVNPDGTVTFNPLPSFTGTVARPITYQVTDILGRTEDATITPTVGPPPVPTASPDALTRAYDTNQTYTPLANDTAGAVDFPLSASSVKLCGINPAETPNNCTQTSLTVPGEGTYTVNGDGTVTFDPLPTFTGTVATPVKYQAKDSLNRFVNTTITPTVLPPPTPTASPDAITTAYDTNQTYTPLANDTAGAADFPLSATSVKLCGINPVQTPNSCDKTSLTVPGEGTYTVNNDGTVSFDPLPTFTGTVATPVKYQAKDSLDRFVNTTITPMIGLPPVPTASPDAITTAYDTNQTYTPLANDTRGATDFPLLASSVKLCGVNPAQTPNSCDKTSVTVTGEGTYTVNPDGTVSFDPLPTFTGTVATPVKYQAKDSLNRFVNTTITPTIGLPPAPTATPDALTRAYDTNQSYTPLGNDTAGATSFPLLATSVKLCGLADASATPQVTAETPNNCTKTSVTVLGEGTYAVNNDGTVSFDPLPTFVGTVATPVKYQAKDSLDRFVNTTITPTVLPPPVPTASPDAITTAYDTNQTYTPLANDTAGAVDFPLSATSVKLCGISPVQTPNSCDKTSLTVPGEGTYTVNNDGTVSFDPLPTFVGTVATPVKYQAKDSLDRFVNTTITPTILPPPAPTASPDAITTAYDTNQTYTPLANDTAGATDFPLSATSVRLCGVSPVQTPNSCDKTTLAVAGEGTYTVNGDGTVSFDPLPTFVGTVAISVKYQAKDSLDRFVNTTITPTILPPPVPTASPDAITTAYDTNQTYTPLANDTRGATDFPLLASSVKLCGVSPVQTPNSCDKTSLTVAGEGTYTVNPDGTVTFDPLPTFVGTVATPVTYQAKDSLNRFVNTTITPTILTAPITVVDDTKTGPYDSNQTIDVLRNDTPSAQWVPTSVRLCGLADASATPPVTAETPNNCTKASLTVPGEGTYTVNADGTVTFDPLPTFVGTVTKPVTYQVSDVLGRTADADITPTVLPPPPPVATPQTQVVVPSGTATYTNVIGTAALATGTQLQSGSTNGPCLVDPSTSNCGTTVVIAGQGTWSIDRTTGIATFVADAGITPGTKTPVTYKVTDIIGQTATSTLTPIVPPPPSATDDYSSGPFDTNQTLTPFSNDSFDSLAPARTASLRLCGASETPNGCTQTTVVVPNEGTFTINSGGTVTFDPLPTFIGNATPLPYQAEDIFGRFVDAALHPSVAAPDAPVATPQTKIVAPGTQVSFTNVIGSAALATGAQLQSGSTNGPCLVDPATNVCGTTVVILGEGTWTIDQNTGVAVFAAEPTITPGTKTPVTYRVTDVIGQTASSTLTPIVPPPPSASNDAQSSPLDENQMYAPLNNDSFSSLSPASLPTLRLCGAGQTPTACDKKTVTVAEEGTYTVNENGTVLFDPLPDFVGTATPMPYQVADILGRIVNATITPTILPPPVPEATQDTGRAKEGNKVVLEPWTNDSAGVVAAGQTGTPALVPTSVRLCPMSTVVKTRLWVAGRADPSCTLMKVTTADGTYTVDPKTGKVTFVHRKGFTGTVTQPVPYQIATNWKVPTGTLTARSMLIPTIISKRVPMVTIGDKVWRDVKGDGYQNRKDRGIPGVKVTISTTAGGVVTDIFGNVVGPVITNKKGLYKFSDLPAGQYKVTVTYPPGLRPTIANRPGRNRNSSTGSAISRNLRLGQSDNSLDFGMVAFDNTLLPSTS